MANGDCTSLSEVHYRSMQIDWIDVLRDWEVDEVEHYRELYESRGFDSWLEWRQSYIDDLHLDTREWTQEQLARSYEVIPTFVIGGYPGWHKYRPAGLDLARFTDVARPPSDGELSMLGESRVDVRTNEGVMRFTRELADAKILVIQCDDLRVILDGTHRSAAIAVAARDGLDRLVDSVTVRTCHFDSSERSILESFAKDRRAVIKKKND